MKKKLLIIIGLVVIFIVFIFVRFFWLDRQNASGKIKILSSPAATVFIDNVAVGKTPYEINNQKVGEYTIKLIPDEADKKTVTWEGKIPVYNNTLTYVGRELGTSELTSAGEMLTVVKMEQKPEGNTGEVLIETEPAGAIIYLDNDEKGVAPLKLDDVPTGDHELAVYLPGFFRRALRIKVEKGYQVKANFKLALDQSHKSLEAELEAARKVASDEAKKKEEESASKATANSSNTIEILDTEVGYLNVRSKASVSGDIVTTVNPGDQFEYEEEENGWYKITTDDGSGWVSGDYVDVVE
ncbi:MAG TPA: PEGA domain-containing protein [Candidatus Woesebacteria bacterium]|nr:PEGA domain-containing protein [Candidatus Woesebacteria bacterium]